jgi:hypothetical protein
MGGCQTNAKPDQLPDKAAIDFLGAAMAKPTKLEVMKGNSG